MYIENDITLQGHLFCTAVPCNAYCVAISVFVCFSTFGHYESFQTENKPMSDDMLLISYKLLLGGINIYFLVRTKANGQPGIPYSCRVMLLISSRPVNTSYLPLPDDYWQHVEATYNDRTPSCFRPLIWTAFFSYIFHVLLTVLFSPSLKHGVAHLFAEQLLSKLLLSMIFYDSVRYLPESRCDFQDTRKVAAAAKSMVSTSKFSCMAPGKENVFSRPWECH